MLPAPIFLTGNPSHGADLVVAADRTFRSFMRAGRSAGLRLPDALRMANRQTQARTGMDMLAEMGVEPPEDETAAPAIDPGAVAAFAEEWLSGQIPLPATICRSADLFRAYLHWCGLRDAYPVPINQFNPLLRAAAPEIHTTTRHVRHGGKIGTMRVVTVGQAERAITSNISAALGAEVDRFTAALAAWMVSG